MFRNKMPLRTHLSNVRFPSRPRALEVLTASGLALGTGFGGGGGSATGVLVTAGSSVVFLVSSRLDSVDGAEINALI